VLRFFCEESVRKLDSTKIGPLEDVAVEVEAFDLLNSIMDAEGSDDEEKIHETIEDCLYHPA
jgi:hypothetical protein